MRTSDKVLEWAKDRCILENGTKYGQLSELYEQAGALGTSMMFDNLDGVMSDIGDLQIRLIIIAEMYGISAQDCLDNAFAELKG